MHKVYPATMTDGTEYTGNQQYKGMGQVRWCALCGEHRTMGDGSMRLVFGLKQWCCRTHKKVAPNA